MVAGPRGDQDAAVSVVGERGHDVRRLPLAQQRAQHVATAGMHVRARPSRPLAAVASCSCRTDTTSSLQRRDAGELRFDGLLLAAGQRADAHVAPRPLCSAHSSSSRGGDGVSVDDLSVAYDADRQVGGRAEGTDPGYVRPRDAASERAQIQVDERAAGHDRQHPAEGQERTEGQRRLAAGGDTRAAHDEDPDE